MVSDALVVGLDVGGSSVKAWVCGPSGVVAGATRPLPTLRPAPGRAEMDPERWWALCLEALAEAVAGTPAGAGEWAGLTVSSLRQGFVLLDTAGAVLGPGVLNSDRRGSSALDELRARPDLYATTGHWPAPELTLAKLLHLRREEPQRWAAAGRLLFLHDWLLLRLTGEQVTEVSYACAGQLADVGARGWALDLLDALEVPRRLLAPLVEAGDRVGTLTAPLAGLPRGLPVHAGCGDTQLAAAGAGGLEAGAVTVVVGSSTPVVAATAAPLRDAEQHPWVSTHARRDLWAAETNCGYPGTMAGWLRTLTDGAAPSGVPGAHGVTAVTATPAWTEQAWARKAPMSLVGLTAGTTAEDLAQAAVESHAYAVAANVEDLERALGSRAGRLVVTGGGAAPATAALVAEVLGREVDLVTGSTAGAGWALVTGAEAPGAVSVRCPAGDADRYAAARARWTECATVLQSSLGID